MTVLFSDIRNFTGLSERMTPDENFAFINAYLARMGPVIRQHGGFIDKFPMGAIVNRSLTIKSGQTHVHRYMRPLLDRIQNDEIDPSFVVTHRMSLDDAPEAYDMFLNKEDECLKVVLKP